MAERVTDERNARRDHTSELDPTLDTFPKLVQKNAERMGAKVAIREKDLGIWQSYTWRDYLDRARLIALGLAALGFTRGDKTAIIGDNRPQLYWAMLATQALGGVPVPVITQESTGFDLDPAALRAGELRNVVSGDRGVDAGLIERVTMVASPEPFEVRAKGADDRDAGPRRRHEL